MEDRIARIKRMQALYDSCRRIVDELRRSFTELENHRDDFKELFAYSWSRTWMRDFEADEKGELPKDLVRGILSEDALYDLLIDYGILTDDMARWQARNEDITDEEAMPYVDELDEFRLFDPMEGGVPELMASPGNYIVTLRHGHGFPGSGPVPKMPVFDGHPVIYVGRSGSGLRRRICHDHLVGHSGLSTLRLSLGCLMGYPLIPRDRVPDGKHWRFSDENEKALSNWMRESLLFYYRRDRANKEFERVLITRFLPPLNIDGCYDKGNKEFRTRLRRLRSAK